jgi:hypothetical protein
MHFHVKILGDVSKRIAESIRQRVARSHAGVAVEFNYPLDLGPDDFEAERDGLIDEIIRIIGPGITSIQVVQRQSIALTVRIRPQRPSVTMTEHGYNPYRQAEAVRHIVPIPTPCRRQTVGTGLTGWSSRPGPSSRCTTTSLTTPTSRPMDR